MKLSPAILIVLLSCCAAARAADAIDPSSTGAKMVVVAKWFLDSLNDAQRSEVQLRFDDAARLDWHNIPKPDRKGLSLRDLSADQQRLCHALLKAALSKTGYDKAEKIMALEANLHEGEKDRTDGPVRDPLRYYITIFGEPATGGTWGWSFEGHHFSLNFVIEDSRVIADTPSFWGANPATVHTFVEGGPPAGTRTLADEEQLAFDLLDSLDDTQRKRAVIADKAPGDYRAPGSPQPPHSPPAGLPAADMTPAQKDILRKLLASYCGHLADDIASERLKKIENRGLDNVHFAWLGAQEPGIGHAYRIQGPTFVFELVNIQSDPAGNPANHIHSVWRSLEGDFGVGAR